MCVCVCVCVCKWSLIDTNDIEVYLDSLIHGHVFVVRGVSDLLLHVGEQHSFVIADAFNKHHVVFGLGTSDFRCVSVNGECASECE